MRRLPFYATVAILAILCFGWLTLRSRPLRGAAGLEPVLFASNLHQPRAVAVGADGSLYVAEAGWAVPGQTAVAGRLTRITARDETSVVVEGLAAAGASQPLFTQGGPSALASTSPPPPSTTGTEARLHVLFGATEGRPSGSLAELDVSAGQGVLGPPSAITIDAQTVEGTPATVWGAQVSGNALLAALPQANLLTRIDSAVGPAIGRGAAVTGFIGEGGSNPHPTGIALAADGSIFVAHFGAEPFRPGSGRVVIVAPDGRWQPRFEGLNFPVAVAFAPSGQLFVLEFASGYDARAGRFTPRSGRLLAIGPEPNRRRIIVRDIDYPTALTFSGFGDAYFTEGGAFRGPGAGRILLVPGQSLLPGR
ncbi:MAG: ScyD/ScyE family protein [Chloroflexota bacterium]|nr:ScyD/ScyE family protein [Chloroflexota bacterium]